MSHADITLTPQDAYVLARAIVGLPYDGVPLSPLTGLLLAHLDPKMHDDLQILRRVLGQQLMLEVLRVDPDAAPPEAPFRNTDLNIVPDLPETARLTEAQIKEASSVGAWLDDYISWAGRAANETPLSFHMGAGLYLAALAVGPRLMPPIRGALRRGYHRSKALPTLCGLIRLPRREISRKFHHDVVSKSLTHTALKTVNWLSRWLTQ